MLSKNNPPPPPPDPLPPPQNKNTSEKQVKTHKAAPGRSTLSKLSHATSKNKQKTSQNTQGRRRTKHTFITQSHHFRKQVKHTGPPQDESHIHNSVTPLQKTNQTHRAASGRITHSQLSHTTSENKSNTQGRPRTKHTGVTVGLQQNNKHGLRCTCRRPYGRRMIIRLYSNKSVLHCTCR